jgi:superfamily I DNA/RNA helicase
MTERTYFRKPHTPEWSQHLSLGDAPELRCSTIHEAKGREYEAVCLVIPPDRGAISHTTQLFDAWVHRSADEGKRVIYVGVTRAKKLVCLSIPTAFKEQLVEILTGSGISFVLRSLGSTDATPTPAATSLDSGA